MGDVRDPKGRFLKGHPGGPGRPSRPKEQSYLLTMASVCDEAAWERIVRKAVEQAAEGDDKARSWLTRYLVGEPSGHAPALREIAAAEAQGGALAADDGLPAALDFAAAARILERLKANPPRPPRRLTPREEFALAGEAVGRDLEPDEVDIMADLRAEVGDAWVDAEEAAARERLGPVGTVDADH